MLILTLYFSPSYTPSSSFSIFLSISLHSQSLALPFIFNTISISPSLPLSQSVCLLAPPPLSLLSHSLFHSLNLPVSSVSISPIYTYPSLSSFTSPFLPFSSISLPPFFPSLHSLLLPIFFFLFLHMYLIDFSFSPFSLISSHLFPSLPPFLPPPLLCLSKILR